MRVILTKTEADANAALAALQKDDSDESFKKVASKYSIDEATKSTGGLRQGVVEGQSEPALDDQIFTAPLNQLVGPFKGDAGFYVIEVQKITPAVTQPLERRQRSDPPDARRAQRQQQIAQDFQTDFQNKWIARTFCADGYRIDRCSNVEPPPPTVHRAADQDDRLRRARAAARRVRAGHPGRLRRRRRRRSSRRGRSARAPPRAERAAASGSRPRRGPAGLGPARLRAARRRGARRDRSPPGSVPPGTAPQTAPPAPPGG